MRARQRDARPFPGGCVLRGARGWAADDAAVDESDTGRVLREELADLAGGAWGYGVEVEVVQRRGLPRSNVILGLEYVRDAFCCRYCVPRGDDGEDVVGFGDQFYVGGEAFDGGGLGARLGGGTSVADVGYHCVVVSDEETSYAEAHFSDGDDGYCG